MNIKLVRYGAAILFICTVMSFFAVLNTGAVIPALAGLSMIVYGGFYDELKARKKENRLTSALHGAGRAVLFVYIVLQFACVVMMCEAALKPRAYKHKRGYDAVVVLGAGFWGDEVSFVLEERLGIAAKTLAAYPDAVAVLTGSQVGREGTSEAELMREYLTDNYGVDPKRLLLENRARTTLENFEYTQKLLDARFGGDPCSVLVVTSDFHIFRSEKIARLDGFKADWIAAKTAAFVLPSYAIRETGAIIFSGYLFE